jgi:hypothetical protein
VIDKFKDFFKSNIHNISPDMIEESFGVEYREIFENPGIYIPQL